MVDVVDHVATWLAPKLECQCCGTKVNVERRPQKTSYIFGGVEGDPDDPNYMNLCPPCQEESDAYWQERWDEYYQGRL